MKVISAATMSKLVGLSLNSAKLKIIHKRDPNNGIRNVFSDPIANSRRCKVSKSKAVIEKVVQYLSNTWNAFRHFVHWSLFEILFYTCYCQGVNQIQECKIFTVNCAIFLSLLDIMVESKAFLQLVWRQFFVSGIELRSCKFLWLNKHSFALTCWYKMHMVIRKYSFNFLEVFTMFHLHDELLRHIVFYYVQHVIYIVLYVLHNR